jgi:transposase-like protein
LRLEAAERFEQGATNAEVATELRVAKQSVERWRKAWKAGGAQALASAGPVSREQLS